LGGPDNPVSGVPASPSGLRPFGAEPAAQSQAEPLVPNALRRVRWFSDGTASAVATKLDIAEHGVDAGPVVICDTGAEDEDNYRFRAECEDWFGCKVTVIKSEKYDDVFDVWQSVRFMSGPNGAPCSREMKFVPRLNFERPTDTHVFGYTADASDVKRATRLRADFSPLATLVTPLIEQGITKAACMAMVEGAGIKLPRTYGMGFPNANCLQRGCVKATSPRYWALFREHFPERFAKTAALAREIGVRLVIMGREKQPDGTYKNIRGFIDDIPADHPTLNPIVPDCDFLCAMHQQDLAA
jgi:hypothetical protein